MSEQEMIARLRKGTVTWAELKQAADIIEGLQEASRTPEGMVMVPREPTEAMLDAYWTQTGESKEMRARVHAYMRRYWTAMLSAAPTPKGAE